MIPLDQGGGGYTLSMQRIPNLELAQKLLFRQSGKYFFAPDLWLMFGTTV
jgi:hypothetical protein